MTAGGLQGGMGRAGALQVASLLRRGFQLTFDALLLVDRCSHPGRITVGPGAAPVLIMQPQQLAEPPAT